MTVHPAANLRCAVVAWSLRLLLVANALAACQPAVAYESDVHFGLTKWLALRAGFDVSAAGAIALGDGRQDGGMIETQALSLEYACLTPDRTVAREVQQRGYPAARAVPAAPTERAVEPGSNAAREALRELTSRLKGKEGLMLGMYGQALHPLQDSWSHQGVPGAWRQPALNCDPTLLSAHAMAAGGPDSHEPDLTRHSPADVLAMAKATYEALLAYPMIDGRARRASDWPSLVALVEDFARLSSKTAKRAWFVRQGITDTGFLEGISLPDGPLPGPLNWTGGKLPELTRNESIQHDAPADVRAFCDELLRRWLSDEPVLQVVKALAGARAAREPDRQLVARLALWKWRDHGSVATLAHAAAPLTAAELREAARLTRDPAGFVHTTSTKDAVFPLQPLAPTPTPLVPYIVRPVPAAFAQQPRMLAVLRLRHAPYDALGFLLERTDGSWRLVNVLSAVDY